MTDPQFTERLDAYIAAGETGTLAAQLSWEDLRRLEGLCRRAADLFDQAASERAALDEGELTLADLAARAQR